MTTVDELMAKHTAVAKAHMRHVEEHRAAQEALRQAEAQLDNSDSTLRDIERQIIRAVRDRAFPVHGAT